MKIVIPGMIPPSPNELRRRYRSPHAYARLRDMWQQAIFVYTRAVDRNELRSVSPNRRMIVKMIFHNAREYDPDNLAGCQKPILDALKRLGYIHDDRTEWLLLLEPEWNRAPRKMRKTEIDISAYSNQMA